MFTGAAAVAGMECGFPLNVDAALLAEVEQQRRVDEVLPAKLQ